MMWAICIPLRMPKCRLVVIVVSIVSVTAERNGWTIGRTDSQRDLLHQYRVLTRDNKKLSCHREAARCLVLLSILVSHLRLL